MICVCVSILRDLDNSGTDMILHNNVASHWSWGKKTRPKFHYTFSFKTKVESGRPLET